MPGRGHQSSPAPAFETKPDLELYQTGHYGVTGIANHDPALWERVRHMVRHRTNSDGRCEGIDWLTVSKGLDAKRASIKGQ